MTTKNKIDRFPYEINIRPNEYGAYYASIPDFPTIFTGGQSPAEAMNNAIDAIKLMIEEYQERKLPIPEPASHFSGHFNIRVPRTLHRELSRRADAEGISLNALVNFLLTQATIHSMNQ